MDNQQPEKKTEGSAEVIAAPETAPTPQAKKTAPGLGLWLLTLVIAVAGVGLSVFLWQGDAAQQQSLQQNLK